MTDGKVRPICPVSVDSGPEPDVDLIATLKRLTECAEAGTLTGLTGVAIFDGGDEIADNLELIDEGFSMSHADVALALDDLSAEYKLAWRLERFGE